MVYRTVMEALSDPSVVREPTTGVSWSEPAGSTEATVTLPLWFVDVLTITLEWSAQRIGTVNPEVREKLDRSAAELRGYVEVGDGEATQV